MLPGGFPTGGASVTAGGGAASANVCGLPVFAKPAGGGAANPTGGGEGEVEGEGVGEGGAFGTTGLGATPAPSGAASAASRSLMCFSATSLLGALGASLR